MPSWRNFNGIPNRRQIVPTLPFITLRASLFHIYGSLYCLPLIEEGSSISLSDLIYLFRKYVSISGRKTRGIIEFAARFGATFSVSWNNSIYVRTRATDLLAISWSRNVLFIYVYIRTRSISILRWKYSWPNGSNFRFASQGDTYGYKDWSLDTLMKSPLNIDSERRKITIKSERETEKRQVHYF